MVSTLFNLEIGTENRFFFLQSQNPVQMDLVTVFDAILTSGQTREKLQCLYENLISNNFRRTAVLKIILLHEKFSLEQ